MALPDSRLHDRRRLGEAGFERLNASLQFYDLNDALFDALPVSLLIAPLQSDYHFVRRPCVDGMSHLGKAGFGLHRSRALGRERRQSLLHELVACGVGGSRLVPLSLGLLRAGLHGGERIPCRRDLIRRELARGQMRAVTETA